MKISRLGVNRTLIGGFGDLCPTVERRAYEFDFINFGQVNKPQDGSCIVKKQVFTQSGQYCNRGDHRRECGAVTCDIDIQFGYGVGKYDLVHR